MIMTISSSRIRFALAGLAILSLAACSEGGTEPEPEATEGATSEAGEEPASIIREDIAVERDAAPLAPLTLSIPFAETGEELSDATRRQLDEAMASPQMAAGGVILLHGHTDSAGSDAANLRVSLERAEAVRDYLLEQGVAAGRMRVVAFGEQNPARPNALPDGSPDEEGRAANRRVELTIEVPEGTPEADPVARPN